MRKHRALLIGLAAMAVALIGASSASAVNIGISPTSVTATNTGQLTLANSIVSVACNLSLTATFRSSTTLSGGSSTQVGGVTSGAATGCVGGTVTLLSPSSWTISGLLPLPTNGDQANVQINNAAILVAVSGQSCLYQGNLVAALNSSGNTLTFDPANNDIPLISGGFLCQLGGNGSLEGTLGVSPAVTITLS